MGYSSDTVLVTQRTVIMPPNVTGKAAKKASKSQSSASQGDKRKKRKKRELRNLYLQSAEASSPRHRHLVQSHDHYEQLRQRHLRKDCSRIFSPCSLQQTINDYQP